MNFSVNQKTEGIALVSALMVLVVIMVLGVASMQLAQVNLMNTSNHRSTALAKQNANSGIDAALHALQQHATATGSLPAALQLPEVRFAGEIGLNFEIQEYSVETTLAEQHFSLQVRGYGQKEDDVYVGEATGMVSLGGESGTNASGHPQFFKGVYAGRDYSSSNETILIDAGLHAGDGLHFTGSGLRAYNCETRHETSGQCTSGPPSTQDRRVPVTGGAGASCSYSVNSAAAGAHLSFCEDGGIAENHSTTSDPGTDPVTGEPVYLADPPAILSKMLCEIATNGECDANQAAAYTTYADLRSAFSSEPCSAGGQGCFTISESNGNVGNANAFNNMFGGIRPPAGSIIHIRPGVSISGNAQDWGGYTIINDGTLSFWGGKGSLRNTTLITNQNITFGGTWDYTNATIVSEKSVKTNSRPTLDNTTMISTTQVVDLNGLIAKNSRIYAEHNFVVHGTTGLAGETTIVTNGTLTLNNPTTDTLDGTSRAALIANGKMTFHGGVTGYVNLLGNSDIDFGNPANIFGGIVAHGNVNLRGGTSTIDSGVDIRNPYLPGHAETPHTNDFIVRSRR